MSSVLRYKPLDIELTDADNNKHRAQFIREQDTRNQYGGMDSGEYSVLVSPSLCNKSFSYFDEFFDEDVTVDPSEFAIDISEWIGSAIIEGQEMENVDGPHKVSYVVQNPDDLDFNEDFTYQIFGGMMDIGTIDATNPYIEHIKDKVVVTDDPVTIKMIQEKFPNLKSVTVHDSYGEEDLKELSRRSFNKKMFKAALLSLQVKAHLNFSDTLAKHVLGDVTNSLNINDSTTLNQLEIMANESRYADQWISRVESTLNSKSFPTLNKEANNLRLDMNVKIVSPDDVLQNLPLVEIGSALTIESRKTKGVDCEAYYITPDGGATSLLGVAVPDENNPSKVKLYSGPGVPSAFRFGPPKEKVDNDLSYRPKFNR